ncbi:GTS1-transcription factor of the Gcs1p Glo3p Sps18p family [Fusarium beomiforme]|uniref:GTS1-transcription factor of the Gcs1p Glo3p Sps18p family n=1 Tax=Fusarium beomiforme TaxID=44412 RepID=A0A9P5DSX9_9HYPO|nr:GTS1-transcription factor of the Gcs1p Glo3p Sps18p family [Fusarium beomiforme]
MSSIMSKRQQARNEKALQDLVQNIPGNNMCADCHARNPAWASWSLGTHISKVKSLSMDSWTNEQVDNMRKVGNVNSNNIYNPEHRKPPVPVDADEADSAMERFIRQKYMNNTVSGTGKPKSPHIGEGTPPPLPPKNSKFGFRSASSIFPLSSKSKKDAKTQATGQVGRTESPRPPNKPSKVFGATLDLDQPDDMEQKLARLQDMGFQDAKRNALVLKGVNGNLERAIETLVRLGEGSGRPSPLPTPSPREQTLRTSRSLTPLTPSSGGLGLGAGLSVPSRPATDRPMTPSSASTNPFDSLGTAQPQTAQSTGSLHNRNPYGQTNPFDAPASQQPQPTDGFSQAFQNMSLLPQQPLFPHHTGGPAPQQAPQATGYQQVAPSAPTTPSGFSSLGFSSNMTYPQPVQAQATGYNPFLSNTASAVQQQSQQGSNPFPQVNTNQASAGYNPFTRSPTRIASPSLGQIPEQAQSSFQNPSVYQGSTVYQSPAPLSPPETATNPFFANVSQPVAQIGQQVFGQQPVVQQMQSQPQGNHNPFTQQQSGQQFYGQQPQMLQQQPQQFYQPQRPDKASIMALFNNYPQTTQQQPSTDSAQPPYQIQQASQYSKQPTIPEKQTMQAPMAPVQQQHRVPQSVSSSRNPFMSGAPSSGAVTNTNVGTTSEPFAARSRESMNLGLDLAWTNGRHSPDAFASLSARHG